MIQQISQHPHFKYGCHLLPRRFIGRVLSHEMKHFEVLTPGQGIRVPLLVHIPHSATAVPPPWRDRIVLDAAALEHELLAMTDRHTDGIFSPHALEVGGAAFVNGLSRLVFDPERFADDAQEPMASKGMGAVYTHTSTGERLRDRDFSAGDRDALLRDLFHPYASALERAVTSHLDRFGRCLIIDAHSFPSQALPYEDATLERPDLCLGYDAYHAPETTLAALERVAREAGWSCARNTPFAGSYVPEALFRRDPRVVSVMIELNRRRYMNEATGERGPGFAETSAFVGNLIDTALRFEAFRNTRYHAETPDGALVIRIGAPCPELDTVLQAHRLDSWAYVTAFNPRGRTAADDLNREAQRRLECELDERQLPWHPGATQADLGDWPPEPSCLVLGIQKGDAIDLGRRYGQAAIAAGRLGEKAELVIAE